MSREEPACLDPDDPIGVFPGPSDGERHHAPERWRETVSAEAVTHLRREGWCVIDGFLSGADGGGGGGADEAPGGDAGNAAGGSHAGSPVDRDARALWASALRDEIKWLSSVGLVRPNRTHFANHQGERYLFSKPHVFEADMHDANVRGRVPALARFFEAAASALPDAFAEADARAERALGEGAGSSPGGGEAADAADRGATEQKKNSPFPSPPLARLARGDAARAVKLQHNKGEGGCFPSHYDNPGGSCRRLLTCILYLNPGWTEGDGGELTLTPFLGASVRVRPQHDRLAAFYSDRVLHRVEPSRVDRFCLTVWLDGVSGATNAPQDVALKVSNAVDPDSVAETLRVSPAQRSLSRAVYAEEYRASLRRCMAGAEGLEEMLASHETAVRAVRSNGPLAALVEALRERKAFAEMGGEVEV